MREVSPFPSNNFYEVFREWLNEHYSILDDTTWPTIIAADATYDYENLGNGFTDDIIDYEEEIIIDASGSINQQE